MTTAEQLESLKQNAQEWEQKCQTAERQRRHLLRELFMLARDCDDCARQCLCGTIACRCQEILRLIEDGEEAFRK